MLFYFIFLNSNEGKNIYNFVDGRVCVFYVFLLLLLLLLLLMDVCVITLQWVFYFIFYYLIFKF